MSHCIFETCYLEVTTQTYIIQKRHTNPKSIRIACDVCPGVRQLSPPMTIIANASLPGRSTIPKKHPADFTKQKDTHIHTFSYHDISDVFFPTIVPIAPSALNQMLAIANKYSPYILVYPSLCIVVVLNQAKSPTSDAEQCELQFDLIHEITY